MGIRRFFRTFATISIYVFINIAIEMINNFIFPSGTLLIFFVRPAESDIFILLL